ncbi:MAG: head GIN domain-containing protein [Bacteroidota bacterium]
MLKSKINFNNLFILALLVFSMSSCSTQDRIVGSGPIVEEAFDMQSFDGIHLDCSADIFVKQGDRQEVVVRGNANIIERLKRDVVNGVWRVDLMRGNYRFNELTIFVTVPNFNSMTIDGSGDVEFEAINTNAMQIKIDGSGDVTFQEGLTTDELKILIDGSGNINVRDLNTALTDVRIDGSGELYLAGVSDEAKYRIDGSGDIDAFDLESDHVSVDVDASGDIKVVAKQTLNVVIDASGDVYYKGNPDIFTSIDGSGRVINAN